jgi:hypothetical protein
MRRVPDLAALLAVIAAGLSTRIHPWLDAIRATLPGRLLLGRGFIWLDLPCYAVGALAGWAVERAGLRGR